MMNGTNNVLRVNAHVDMTAASLEAIVKNAKGLQLPNRRKDINDLHI